MRVITTEDLIREGKERYQKLIMPLIMEGALDDFLESTPYVQRKIEELRKQTLEQEVKQGLEQGVKQGVKQGLEQGHLTARRRDIIEVLMVRLGLDDQGVAGLESRLSAITDEHRLRDLLHLALRVEQVAAFEAALEDA